MPAAARARTLVEGGAAQVAVPGCGPLVVNYGQTGYYRTLYSAPLLARLIQSYGQLRPIDQIGLLADNWALGLAGYQPASAALDMADAAPADANDRLVCRVATMLAQIDGMYDGDPAHQAMVRHYASAAARAGAAPAGLGAAGREPASDAVLRDTLIADLGAAGRSRRGRRGRSPLRRRRPVGDRGAAARDHPRRGRAQRRRRDLGPAARHGPRRAQSPGPRPALRPARQRPRSGARPARARPRLDRRARRDQFGAA